MLQKCYFYKTEGDANQVLVLFEPCDKQNIPFYHPQVEALVFHYNSKHLTISYIPLDNQDQHSDDDDTGIRQRINRLERTMFQLAIIISKHSSGNMNNYQKRVEHDLVVAKHDWQDLYTELKGRYASEKHVFEDLGIASFLINLRLQIAESLGSQRPVTFVDLGCGNGLLVEILMREGIETSGFDARRRKSWDVYTAATQAVLQEMVLYPEMLSTEQGAERSDSALETMATMVELNYGLFDRNQFLIGNHADELTPYIPLLAALSSCSNDVELGPDVIPTAGFLIIPCCTHTFSGEKHNGLSTKGGRYASYIAWLIDICEEVGWVVERESLRIPSTRNCAIICRRRKLVENSADSADPDSVGHPGKQTPRDRLVNLCRGIITRNGGMDNFLERSRSLTSTKPRTH
ncbi:protein of unknown function [Taphrina deformans PYCC 5710]|uniref:tRNA (uracil-O(2)-)-methyltransferase n=1 Tax=Taphrina deformans (strain PYCC 5710 / ATCC 11124 / CBS 356.35 / IMI 108563 / JCM 9778 / NBRC 8474) TaxID=1097556 RepID=R4XDW8_TAPDE|nr:protein of unknown function [Taphrina deformans PYCC 5710]|eukprot:CCG83842.1 protein of unknown function [Taphrina deformans PYCC 5710]